MSKKSVKIYSGKRTPLKSSLKGGNILKEPSPSDKADTDSNSKDSNDARRSIRNVKEEEQTKENRQLKEKGTTSNWLEEIGDVYIECVKLEYDTQSVKVKEERLTPEKESRKPEETTETPGTEGSAGNTPEKNVGEHSCTVCYKSFKSGAGLKIHSKKCRDLAMEVNNSVIANIIKSEKIAPEDDGAASESPMKKDGKPLPNEWAIAVAECYCCGEDLQTAHKTGEFQCYNCCKLFLLKASLERHQKLIHMEESHECLQCGAKCPDKKALSDHMHTHSGLKPYSCPVCKQEFSRKYHLVRHNMQTGCDGKARPIFSCQVCGREFKRKDNLTEHLRAHAGETKRKKILTCDFCGMEFCGTQLLQLHRRTHAGEKQYCCDFCPKRFPSIGKMKNHRRTHTGERPFKCATCDKSFAAKETLDRHVRIHTGYKPHACQYCNKRFIQSSQLRSHLLYHTGERVIQPAEVFICEVCGKTFNRRARLNEHTKFIHLGAKPFECEDCKKTFMRKEELTRHLIFHSGVKAHKCPKCSKGFATKSALNVHLLTHTKEPPRSCDECGRAFIRQDCLRRHMRNKHRDKL